MSDVATAEVWLTDLDDHGRLQSPPPVYVGIARLTMKGSAVFIVSTTGISLTQATKVRPDNLNDHVVRMTATNDSHFISSSAR